MSKNLVGVEKSFFARELEEKAYGLFVLKSKQELIDLKKFAEIYSQNEIERDLGYVRKREAQFSQQEQVTEKKSQILEAIITSRAELDNWFGEDSFVVKTSRFDDIANGVDVVLELVNENGVRQLALAVDVTVSKESGVVGQKLLSIKRELENGQLAGVKYFKSEADKEFMGPLPSLLKLVVGVDPGTLNRLMELSLNKDYKALRNEPVQRQLLEEMELQLRAFLNLSNISDNTKKAIREALKHIEAIIKTKNDLLTNFREDDQSFISIKTAVNSIFTHT